MKDHESNNIERLRSHLAECTVLLKRNGAFPLERPGSIAAYGSGVRNTVKGGTGSGEVNSRYFLTVEQGLIDAGFVLIDTEWLNKYDLKRADAKKDFIKSIKDRAKEEKINIIAASMGAVMKEPEYDLPMKEGADAAIYVLSRISGEGNDRLPEKGDFKLTDTEVRDILWLDARYKKFMLVINTGGPLDLAPVKDVGNILVLSQLGVETGRALADILLGKEVPSGKLATTWTSFEDYPSIGTFGERDDSRYKEGIFVGYRFFDAAGVDPLYPFGFGLGYTDLEWAFTEGNISENIVSLKAEVKNIGAYKGREVLQAYISCPDGRMIKEKRSLAAYAKTKELAPGEKDMIELRFDLLDQSSYDETTAAYILEKGTYTIFLGNSSKDTKAVMKGVLKEDHIVKKVRNAFPKPDFEDWMPGPCTACEDCQDVPSFDIDLSACKAEEVIYGKEPEIDARIEALDEKELAYLNIGSFSEKGGILSVIGNASTSVAGAAGESSFKLKDKGIDNLIMADGPAGLRLARHYYTDEKGVHAIGSTIPETMLDILPGIAKWLLGKMGRPKKGVVVKEQFTTALPIGTAIAQSFNDDFAKLCGDIVGNEMEVFGVDLWLAPALNIHRSVLCGRNFEYFSEDPVISGNMAAALTLGVQSHKGKGVTVKHFAFNNQETNRYGNSSMMSERTAREIYLKGFEIAVKKSHPASVMSSYNLINGEHTSESRALITDILFDEFGFDGIVMTDWIIGGDLLSAGGKYSSPKSFNIVASGHSLMMPGSKKDYEELLKGLEEGRVTAHQLKINASRLLRLIDRLRT